MQLNVFGKVQLEGSSFSRPKPLLILSYLSLAGPQERRKLAELFWADDTGTDPKKALQKKLGKLSVVLAQFKKSDANEVFSYQAGLDPLPSQATTDAQAFLNAIEQNNYQHALNHYKGAFLQDIGKSLDKLDVAQDIIEWVLERREYYATKAQHAMLELAEQKQAEGNSAEAKKLAERAYNLKEAPEAEPSTLNRINKLLSETGSELEDNLESHVENNLEELSETSLKVFLALALQDNPNLTIVKNALKLSLSKLDEAREELILNGLINTDTQVLAQHIARNWLTERPTERMPLLLALARNTPSEKAFSLYKRIFEKTQGFGGMGDLNRARKAYCQEAQKHMDALEYAKAAELLAEARKVEDVLEADAEAQSRFIEAYALERQGQFKEALELIKALPKEELNPNINALGSVLLWRVGKSLEAEQAANKVLQSGIDWSWAKAKASNTLGYLKFSDEDFEGAAACFKKSAGLFQICGDKQRWIGSLSNYSSAVHKKTFSSFKARDVNIKSLIQRAEKVYLDTLEAAEEIPNNKILKSRILFNIGVFWADFEEWHKAEKYYLGAKPLIESSQVADWHPRLFSNLGNLYLSQNKFSEARRSYLKAIDYAVKAGEFLYQGIALAHLAYLDKDLDSMELALGLLKDCNNENWHEIFINDYEEMLLGRLESGLLANDSILAESVLMKLNNVYEKKQDFSRGANVNEALQTLSQLTDLKSSKDLLMAFVRPLDEWENQKINPN